MTTPRQQTLTAITIASAIFAVTSAAPARAQIIVDMSLITCKQYLESDPERQELVAAWMSGFFNASRNQPRVDFARFALNKKHSTTTAPCGWNIRCTPSWLSRSIG